MATDGRRINVGTTPSRLTSEATTVGQKNSLVATNQGSASVDLGGPDVESGSGYELKVGATFSVDLEGKDAPYAVAASGTVRVDVFEAGI